MFAGTWTLTKLILRRDRIKLPVWIVGIVGSLIAMVPLLRDMYGDDAELNTLFSTFGTNPAGLFLTGPMDAPNFGSLMTIETLLWWGLAVAFMNTLLIVRHTRQNEEMGAQELILSGQTHRSSGLFAVLLVALLANTVMATGLGLGLMALESSWGADGAWLFGIAMGAFGLAWAVIAAFIVQLVESSRSANGILAALIGAGFLIRGIGDFMGEVNANGLLQPTFASWFSPFGWLQATRSLTFPEWWPLLAPLAFAVAVLPVAFWLLGRRDVGAGLLPAGKGRARASHLLKSPFGLTLKLQKNIFIGWLAGTLTMVATMGVLGPEISNVYESSPEALALIEALGGSGALIPSFLSAMLAITVVMVLAYAVQGLGRLRAEESSGQLENLLATRLTRLKWLDLHVITVAFGAAVMLAAAGAALALSFNAASSDLKLDVGEYTTAALSYAPLVLVFIGLYALLFGLLPRVAGVVSWTFFGFVGFMSWLGPLLKLDQWILDLSPMSHIAAAPAQDVSVEPLVVMSIASLIMLFVGIIAWRSRNLASD